MQTAHGKVARPRDAASLLIYRQSGAGMAVLVGRRRKRARFLPDVYVFPGGALDACDYQGPPVVLAADAMACMGVGERVSQAHALARAALREAREEAGLRAQATDLRYIGRAITPTHSPVRFHARFFAAPHTHFAGQLLGDGELQDLRWMALHNPDQLPLVDVTAFMLTELAQVLSGQPHTPALLCYRDDQLRTVRSAGP